jgi:hypothetical protein
MARCRSRASDRHPAVTAWRCRSGWIGFAASSADRTIRARAWCVTARLSTAARSSGSTPEPGGAIPAAAATGARPERLDCSALVLRFATWGRSRGRIPLSPWRQAAGLAAGHRRAGGCAAGRRRRRAGAVRLAARPRSWPDAHTGVRDRPADRTNADAGSCAGRRRARQPCASGPGSCVGFARRRARATARAGVIAGHRHRAASSDAGTFANSVRAAAATASTAARTTG